MIKVWAMALAAAAMAVPMAMADTAPREQARAALDAGLTDWQGGGFSPVSGADREATLRVGEAQLWRVSLPAGAKYRVVAACDDDCNDLDLEVFAANGLRLGGDIAVDATPMVDFATRAAGVVFVRAWLANCEQEPCAVAARALRAVEPPPRNVVALASVPPTAQQSAQVRRYLDLQGAKHRAEGFAPEPAAGGETIITLTASAEDGLVAPVPLQAGRTYRVAAVCDDRCGDVDLELYDPEGRLVGRDVLVNDTPFVEVRAAAPGGYAARLWLANCEAERCAAALRVWVR